MVSPELTLMITPPRPCSMRTSASCSSAQRRQDEVLVDEVPPVVTVKRDRRTATSSRRHAHVVDGDVETAESRDHLGHHPGDLLVHAEVGHDGDGLTAFGHDRLRHLDGLGLPEIDDGHRRPRSGQPPGDLLADAGSGPGDERTLSRQIDLDAHGVRQPPCPFTRTIDASLAGTRGRCPSRPDRHRQAGNDRRRLTPPGAPVAPISAGWPDRDPRRHTSTSESRGELLVLSGRLTGEGWSRPWSRHRPWRDP